MTLTEQDLTVICEKILQLDSSIRFVAVVNNLGSIISTEYRQNLMPLMTKEETSYYAIQAVLRAATREDFESKIGRLEYSIGKYERLIRVTVPIRFSGEGTEEENKFYYLLLSFDLKSEVIDVIENKVMPFIEKE